MKGHLLFLLCPDLRAARSVLGDCESGVWMWAWCYVEFVHLFAGNMAILNSKSMILF